MDEDPTFSTFGSKSAAKAFSKIISKIRSDMAAIEASAKNIENSLTKTSRLSIGGGASFGAQNSGGATGFSKSAGGTSALGKISTTDGRLGGIPGVATVGAFGAGALMGGLSGNGVFAGGIAAAGLPDLILRPERALSMENAKFGMAQATGSFGSFQRMMDTARNSFNVQNEQAFMNTMVYGTQRAGMVGLMGGGTVGERRAAAQIGGYNTLAGMAGIDQAAVPGVMQSMMGAPAFYSSMASGVMTRNPVTGELIGIEGQINQRWQGAGLRGSQQEMLDQIDINYGIGSPGRQNLLNDYGGNEDAVDMVIEGLRIRARQGGRPLKENQVQDQMRDIGEAGGLDTKHTQGEEGVRALESAKMNLGAKTLTAATAGIEEATKHITNAVDLLANLEGPLKTLLDGYTTMANQMDVFQTELPTATERLGNFLSGLPGVLMGYLMGRGGLPGLPGRVPGRLPLRALPLRAVVNPVTAAVAATAVTAYVVNKGLQSDRDAAEARASTPGARRAAAAGAGIDSAGQPTGNAPRTQSTTGPYNSAGQPTGRSKGDWFVESDQDARIHYGEMILPNRVASAVRRELDVGKTTGSSARGGVTVNINLTIQKASDQEALHFANRVKRLIEDDQELLSIGSGRLTRATP